MTVIAMTREMGTRGKEVAALLAERLASKLVYHELVDDPPGPGPSEVRRHLNGEEAAPQRPNGSPPPGTRITPEEVLALASRGNVIIRGWGAVRLLRAVPQVLCLRVCAPMEARVAEMMRRLGADERTARREIERNDAAHSSLMRRFFGDDWRDPQDYDLVLNTARISPADCADIVFDAVSRGSFSETEESRRTLADRLSEARIAALLAADPELGPHSRDVYVSVADGAATLYGTVRSSATAREIAQTVGSRADVQEVRNAIQAVGSYVSS